MSISHDDLVVVTGAGGFIGGHLVAHLLEEGHRRVRAVDRKPVAAWHQHFPEAESRVLDLRLLDDCRRAARGARFLYNLAADMGGTGFIETHKADCMLSVLINTHLLLAAREAGCERFFFASSACVYAADRQQEAHAAALRESDAYPAMAEDGYGWEKLFGERMCRHFQEDYGLATRVARYHNVYGELGTWEGGREKAPAAICRKVAEARLGGRREIEVWGDGQQTRSFLYVSDCIQGTRAILDGEIGTPLNLGSDERVTVDELVTIVEEIAGVALARRYRPDAPQGVRGRSSDNTTIRRELGWTPAVPLREGLERTYRWVYDQLVGRSEGRRAFVA